MLLPWIVPTAISSLAWLMLFDPVLSPISWALKEWGVIQSNINFLGDRWHAIAAVCVANIWRGLPFFAISILAGLQAVAPELHEAAALDGASAWQRFFSVTLPTIRVIVLITTLFSIIFTFADFQLIYVLTKGGPANSTHVFGTYAYQTMTSLSAGRRRSPFRCSRSWRSLPLSCCATSGQRTDGHGREQHVFSRGC